MAFTRFHDDGCEVMKHLQESTDVGLYYLNVPGNGDSMPFLADPSVRLQYWGANRHRNFVEVENGLRGMNDKLSRDCKYAPQPSYPANYPVEQKEVTACPRSVLPPWELRGIQTNRWDTLLEDPQTHAVVPFARDEWTHKQRDYATQAP
jgi:hypothetical protein